MCIEITKKKKKEDKSLQKAFLLVRLRQTAFWIIKGSSRIFHFSLKFCNTPTLAWVLFLTLMDNVHTHSRKLISGKYR